MQIIQTEESKIEEIIEMSAKSNTKDRRVETRKKILIQQIQEIEKIDQVHVHSVNFTP